MISSGQKVFEIEHLVNRILQDNETIECFKFRTINKTFDNVIRRRFRKDYKDLTIGYACFRGTAYKSTKGQIVVSNKKEWTNDTIWTLFELLCEIAKSCVKNSETKEQCLQELKKLITPNISCDVLVLQLQDKPYAEGFLKTYAAFGFIYEPLMPIPPSEALPIELIDRMITEWKVKALKLKFQYTNREPVFSKVWSEKKFFTEIYMDKDIRTVRPFEHHLENVDIDLSDSLMSPFPEDLQGFQEKHLVGIIRKLFPAKKYSIVTNHLFGCDFNKVEECFTSLLDAVWIDGSKNIELSIRHFSSVKSYTRLENPRVPSSFKNRPLRHVSEAVSTELDIKYWYTGLDGVHYYGRSFELEDESTKCTLKAEIYVESFRLEQFEELYSREVLPTGNGDCFSLWPLVSDVCDDIKE